MKNTKIMRSGIAALAVVLNLGMLAACSKEETASTTPQAKGNEPAPAQKASFSYMISNKFYAWLMDQNWRQPLLEAANVDMKIIDGGPDDKYKTNTDLKIASGDFPDSAIVNQSQADVYGSQGAFLDLWPLIQKHAPNLKKYIDDRPDYKGLVTTDGKIYGLPVEGPPDSNVLFYREDLAKKAGLKEPKTLDEFTQFLRDLKKANSNVKDFYPFTNRGALLKLSPIFAADGSIDSNNKIHGTYPEGKDVFAPGFKKMIEWYKMAFDEGLIDPEWVAGTLSEDTWQQRMLTGKGAVSIDNYARPGWFMINGGPKNDPNFSTKAMDMPPNINGKPSLFATNPLYRVDRTFVINTKAKDPVGIIKFVDFMYSEKGLNFKSWGIEGQTYKVDNGKKVYTIDYNKETTKKLGEPTWSFFQNRLTFPGPSDKTAHFQFNDSYTSGWIQDYITKNSQTLLILKYTPDEATEIGQINAKVNPLVDSNVVKFVTGKRPLSEFDAFLKEVDAAGYKKMEEIEQKALNRIKGK